MNRKTASDGASAQDLRRHKLELETAEIAWAELQRHFASGRLIAVEPELDLVEVALMFAEDRTSVLKPHLDVGTVHPVSDNEARQWHESDASLWAVVVKPWVLVQQRSRYKRRLN